MDSVPVPTVVYSSAVRLGAPTAEARRSWSALLSHAASGMLLLLVFTLPWEHVVAVEGIGTIGRAVGILALAVCFVSMLVSGRFRRLTRVHVLLLCFVAWGAATAFWSSSPEATLVRLQTNVQLLGMTWLLWQFGTSERECDRILTAFVLGAAVTALITIGDYLTGIALVDNRYAAGGLDPNDLAVVLALAVPIAWHLAIAERPCRLRLLHWCYLPISCFAIVLTGSRGGFLTLLVALCTVPLGFRRTRLSRRIVLLSLLLAGIPSIARFTPASSYERLTTIKSELEQGDMSNRTYIWAAGLELFATHPLTGVGAGAYQDDVASLLGEQRMAHNTFLSVLTEQGLVGELLLLGIIFALVVAAARGIRSRRSTILVLLATWSAGVMTLTWEYRKPTWFVFGLAIALATASVGPTEAHPEGQAPCARV